MQLHRDREKFDAAGARLVVIGQGTPRHADHFREQFDVQGLEILVDPDRAAYAVAGAKVATLGELFGPRSVVAGLKRTATDRVVQGTVQGHAAQLGGVLVVAPGGEVAWAHMAEHAGDNPPNDEVLEAVRAAAGG
ncbi:MAG: AhpC/TSA family protein [Actinomycetota bacterium]|nr:AhpC/TSA family protein [Actinomycetota bacterium]